MIRQNLKLTTSDKLYIPAILKGMWITFKHLIRPDKRVTIQFPEERRERADGYRGFHRLNKDEQGRIKCVACEMCATACPSHCITIEPIPTPVEWTDRDRMPKKFQIDMLKCIYCGMCQEACPKDAIELTKIHDWGAFSREEMIWDKDRLLDMFDKTTDEKYMAQQGFTLNTKDM
ncbi:NuoI/complex I 23 kDa subunit family protein [candidate division KSB1 bacterium]